MPSTRAIVPLVTALILGAYGLAAWRAQTRIRELTWLSGLPRADAASATRGPARYSGRLRGPEGRKSPSGRRAAVYWWGVVYPDSEGETTVYCQGRERSLLTLETRTGPMRIMWTEADPDRVGGISDEADSEYGRPYTIDLGSIKQTSQEMLPAGTCTGEGAVYKQREIPDGAEVEVVGCASDGRIEGCDGPLSGVLSVPDLGGDRRHRVRDVIGLFRYPLGLGALLLLVVGLALAAEAAKVIRPVRPGKGG